MKRALIILAGLAVAGAAAVGAQVGQKPQPASPGDASKPLPEVKAILTAPPLVPPPVDRQGAARVTVNLEMTEAKGTLANGVTYNFWTFGGTVPGPMIRVRVGDTVVMRMRNHEKS